MKTKWAIADLNQYSTRKYVKEQRVDGSGSLVNKTKYLRCTLMDFERNYQFNFLSKQLNYQQFSSFTNYITTNKLNP